MIEILWVMAQLLLVAIVAGVIGGGAVGLIASEVALLWYGRGRYSGQVVGE